MESTPSVDFMQTERSAPYLLQIQWFLRRRGWLDFGRFPRKSVFQMRKKRIIAGGLVIAFVVILVWAVASRPREPMYDGKPLTFWLSRYTDGNRTETSVQEADHALEAIGSNAVPALLHLINAHDLPFEPKLMELLQKQHLIEVDWTSPWEKRELAVYGFRQLRGAGRGAVPELIRIYELAEKDGSASASERRSAVIRALSQMGPAAKEAVPMLIALPLKDTNVFFRAISVDMLGKIHASPEIAVPALIRCLDDPDLRMRSTVAYALGQFGPEAKSAIAPLKASLGNSDFMTKLTIANAISKIDPTALTNIASRTINETK